MVDATEKTSLWRLLDAADGMQGSWGMQGGPGLREPSVQSGASQATTGGRWYEVSRAAEGGSAWERVFRENGRREEFLVTVLFDPVSGKTRTLYTASTTEIDRVPRIPPHVRREAEDFVKQLRNQKQRCA
jgi:hypothetical protein